ncbi:MAG: hypothetical protein AMXMBFR58_24250 [Phycisphaerae bacterium]
MKNRTNRAASVACILLLAVMTGCQNGGMEITNTSDHDVSFTQQMSGGEVRTTLHPGSSMTLPPGSEIEMESFTITDR